ncbi:33971_t:CDS:2 [Gigaspora margarita]|uniref:33971_t:CDS:1 n=1 Tax=Gigaspora margarita TaxID=4874 RepID=A0ABN7VWR1_GIGMA|nr:33971_t:CDS:2 [Gigaspora margarita]
MFTGKFIIENLEQFIIAFHITVIATNDPDQEYEADEISLNVPIYNSFTNTKQVIIKLRILYSTHAPHSTYICSKNSIKPVEATDIDFIYAPNVNVVHNMHESPLITVPGHHSDFDIIIDEIESQVLQTLQTPKKGRKLTTSLHSLHSTIFIYNLNKSVTSNSDLSPAGVETTQLLKGKKRLSDLGSGLSRFEC